MDYLKELLAKLLEKGFATKDEKATIKTLVTALKTKEKEDVKEDVEKVENLPEEKEEDDDDVEKEAKTELDKSLAKLFKKVKGELNEELTDSLKTVIKEMLELKEKKAGIYNKEIQKSEIRKKVNANLREFCKSLIKQDVKKLKELTTDDSGTPYGGYVVDSELSAEIRHLITEYGVARREMTTIQLSKNSYKANNLVTDVVAFWTDEASVIKSSEVVLGQKTLELEKLAVIVAMTNELLDDEEIDLMSFIGGRVAEAFARMEDEAFFIGDGTPTYGGFTGLLNDTNLNEVTMSGTSILNIDADDLIDMVDETPQGALNNGKYYMHRSIMSLIRKLQSTDGIYIYQAPSERGPATIWGYPVVLVEVMPSKSDDAEDTSFVLFGDMKKATILGSKGGLKMALFNTGSIRNVANDADINLLTTDRQAVRWTERVGYIRIIPTALTKLTTNSASA